MQKIQIFTNTFKNLLTRPLTCNAFPKFNNWSNFQIIATMSKKIPKHCQMLSILLCSLEQKKIMISFDL